MFDVYFLRSFITSCQTEGESERERKWKEKRKSRIKRFCLYSPREMSFFPIRLSIFVLDSRIWHFKIFQAIIIYLLYLMIACLSPHFFAYISLRRDIHIWSLFAHKLILSTQINHKRTFEETHFRVYVNRQTKGHAIKQPIQTHTRRLNAEQADVAANDTCIHVHRSQTKM